MRVLVAGASGATGRRLVTELLARDHHVRVVVRAAGRMAQSVRDDPRVEVVVGNVLALDDEALGRLVAGCDAIASCLGHTVSFAGIFGPPWRLVTHSVARLSNAVRIVAQDDSAGRSRQPVRFVLMCSAAVRNRDLHEPLSLPHRALVGLLRALVPPHADNEQAAEYLRTRIGRDNGYLEWAIVRPDALFEEEVPSPYVVEPSPIRSVLFDPGRTSRSNVARFMARLLSDEGLWAQWRGRMPVIYNAGDEPAGD